MPKKVDAYEQEILAAFESGSLRSVATKGELEELRSAARATAVKDRRVNTRTALLIIDVQQGLCEGENNAFDSQKIIARINIVSAKARAAGALVIFIQHESISGYLEFGTGAWQLASGLHAEPSDLRLRKATPDSFHRTELEEVLRTHAISSLVICGMHTEFCVDTTTRRALALGFPVVLVADAHTTEGNEHLSAAQIIRHHNDTLTNITSFGPRARAVMSAELRLGD